jgi:hypothetical protein
MEAVMPQNVIPLTRRAPPSNKKPGEEPFNLGTGDFVNIGNPGGGPVVFTVHGSMFFAPGLAVPTRRFLFAAIRRRARTEPARD